MGCNGNKCDACEPPAWASEMVPKSNCDGLPVQRGGRFDVAMGATGNTFGTQAQAVDYAGARTPGDFIRLAPFGQKRYRLVRVWVYKADDGSSGSVQFGFGQVQHNGKPVQFEMQGSLANSVNPSDIAGCQEAMGCGWTVLNFKCLPDFSNDDPLDIALADYGGAGLTDIDIFFEMQPVKKSQNAC